MRIAVVGEIVEDVYLPEEDRFLGGISMNFARSAARAGAAVTLFSAVGTDPRGARLRARLHEAAGVRSVVRELPGETAEQRIRLEPSGERIFCGFTAGVLERYELTADEIDAVRTSDAVALSSSPELAHVFAQCLGLNPNTVADFSKDSPGGEPGKPETWIADAIEHLRIAFVGGDREHVDRLRAFSAKTDRVIVLTVGADGAYAFQRGATYHQASLVTNPIDTTGCGDAFQGAFTIAALSGSSLGDALLRGSEAASLVARHRGAAD